MKLAYFNEFKLGVVKGDRIVEVTSVVADIPRVGPHDLISRLIERFSDYRSRLEQAAAGAEGAPLAHVRLRPPLPKPGKILCMAGNYLENGTLAEPRPINAFLKNTRAAIGDGDTVVLPGAPATVFHHEAEAGLIFGKRASHVRASEAYDYVFGYINFIDASARGLGPEGMDAFFMGKSWHSFAPMGPYLVTADEIADPQDLHIRLWVDGQLRQDYSTSDMGHKIPETIEWATSIATFNPGDILSLGTNHQGLGPLQQDSRVEMEIDGLGRLHVSVTDRMGREWPKGVDRSMADRIAGRAP